MPEQNCCAFECEPIIEEISDLIDSDRLPGRPALILAAIAGIGGQR